jgi:hypothetical protein
MRDMWWVVAVVGLVVLVATYLTWTASRVDRLQNRATAAHGALDAQLARRAEVAAELVGAAPAARGLVPVQGGSPVNGGMSAGGAAGAELRTAVRAAQAARPDDREAAENDLTRQLRTYVLVIAPDETALTELVAVSRRVALARQMHNDVVRDALAVRRQLAVRALGFARKHPKLGYFDIDDPAIEVPRLAVPASD